MKHLTSILKKGALASALMSAGAAFAGTTATSTTGSTTAIASDAFDGFSATVHAWANGGLGTGISLLTLLVGAGMGVARNSPMPALAGVGTAAFLRWGPEIITTMITNGALV